MEGKKKKKKKLVEGSVLANVWQGYWLHEVCTWGLRMRRDAVRQHWDTGEVQMDSEEVWSLVSMKQSFWLFRTATKFLEVMSIETLDSVLEEISSESKT